MPLRPLPAMHRQCAVGADLQRKIRGSLLLRSPPRSPCFFPGLAALVCEAGRRPTLLRPAPVRPQTLHPRRQQPRILSSAPSSAYFSRGQKKPRNPSPRLRGATCPPAPSACSTAAHNNRARAGSPGPNRSSSRSRKARKSPSSNATASGASCDTIRQGSGKFERPFPADI